VALVVVREGLGASLLQRQSGLRAIQRLHLAFFVAAQHQGMLGRRHVQPHDVFELLHKLRVTRDLEAARQVGLQAVGLPVTHHRAGTDAQLGSHLARAPVRGGCGLALRGQLHQLGHIHLLRRCASGQVPLDAGQTQVDKPLTPAGHRHPPKTHLPPYVLVVPALRGQQNDVRALCLSDAGTSRARELCKLGSLFLGQFNFGGYPHGLAPFGDHRGSMESQPDFKLH
jgi:hypothetical protein